jgi:type I restriction enzyme, S subunit
MKQGWEIKKLGDIGKVSMCMRVFKEDTTSEGDIPFYKIGTFGKSPDAFKQKKNMTSLEVNSRSLKKEIY